MQMADNAIAIRSKYLDELIGSMDLPAQRGGEHTTDTGEHGRYDVNRAARLVKEWRPR